MWVQSLGWEDPLEEGTETHSSILAWRIPGTEEPGKESDTTEATEHHTRLLLYNNQDHRILLGIHSFFSFLLIYFF